MKDILVLGAGLVGLPMALDLNEDPDFNVTLGDHDISRLKNAREKGIKNIIALDVREDDTFRQAVEKSDLVLSAVPGDLGYHTLRKIIGCRKNVVDISFFPEDLFGLDGLAKEKGVTAICDMGVAPGMSHILLASACRELDHVTSARIYVGGLPKDRIHPWEYKAVFSPADVIEEYMRPARFIKNGEIITKPALTDLERITFPSTGELEAFNSDGLRSLLNTMNIPDMVEKTMRYPGYTDKISLLKSSGFFDKEPVEVGRMPVIPLEYTSRILFDAWKLNEGDEDITVMRILVKGKKDNQRKYIQYDLYDEYDREKSIHSMARTTGYAATIVIRLLATGGYDNPGVNPPEFLAEKDENVDFILDGLRQRKVIYQKTITSG